MGELPSHLDECEFVMYDTKTGKVVMTGIASNIEYDSNRSEAKTNANYVKDDIE